MKEPSQEAIKAALSKSHDMSGMWDDYGFMREVLTAAYAVDFYKSQASPEIAAFFALVKDGLDEAEKAMRKFPQPNYVISKVAEEAGEVVKAAIHCAEKRETPENVRSEMRQLIAMLYRLWAEGDQIHGLPALAALALAEKEGLTL